MFFLSGVGRLTGGWSERKKKKGKIKGKRLFLYYTIIVKSKSIQARESKTNPNQKWEGASC
jgi:hypothetical protein